MTLRASTQLARHYTLLHDAINGNDGYPFPTIVDEIEIAFSTPQQALAKVLQADVRSLTSFFTTLYRL